MRDFSQIRRVPDPTPLLFLVASALVWVMLSGDAGPAGPWVLGAIFAPAGCALLYVLSTRVEAALLGLLAAAVMSRFFLDVGGLKARPEHIMIGLLCIAGIFHWRRRTAPVRWIVADFFVLGYIGLNLFSSLEMSVDPSQTLKWAAQQILVILAYFLLRIFAGQPETFRRAVRVLVAVGAVEGAYAVVCFFSNLLFHTSFGVEIDQYDTFPGTYGTLYEANILGAFCAASLVMALVLYFQERRKIYLLATALTYAGMIIALSRAAIIASAVSLTVLFIAGKKAGMVDWRAIKAVTVTFLAASLMLAPAIIPLYVERFSSVQVSDISADADTAVRVVTIGMAIDDIAQEPFFGNGTSSFQLLVSNREIGFGLTEDQGAWIGNLEMRVMHDTGSVGLAVFVCFLLYLIVPAWKLLRKDLNAELLALLLAALVYSMTFQATEGTLLAFFWVHAGLIACALSIFYVPGGPRAVENIRIAEQ